MQLNVGEADEAGKDRDEGGEEGNTCGERDEEEEKEEKMRSEGS